MNEVNRKLYKFSVTVQSVDYSFVTCLRSLAQVSQKTGNSRVSWGGTGDMIWKKNDHCVTFRFTSSDYREFFVEEIERLFSGVTWTIVKTSDNNPPY